MALIAPALTDVFGGQVDMMFIGLQPGDIPATGRTCRSPSAPRDHRLAALAHMHMFDANDLGATVSQAP